MRRVDTTARPHLRHEEISLKEDRPTMRVLIGLAAIAATLMLPSAARAWPDRPVTIISNFGAGSPVDLIARLIAPKLQGAWGQPVVVQNVVGAAGVIGADRVAKAVPDGHTLLVTGDAAMVVRGSMDPKPPYVTQRDLAPISQLAITPNILVVANAVPAANLQELLAFGRARPGQLTFAHLGAGTSQHIGGEMLRQMTGVELTPVSYNDAGAQIQDVLAGRVTMSFNNVVATLPRIRDGSWRALGVSSTSRIAAAPEIPTIAEQGVPGFAAVAWLGLLAPAGTPPALLARLHADAFAALRAPDLQPRFLELGIEPVGSTPEEFAALIGREIPRMAGVLERAGMLAPR
jgi:tripartite-type tricarboxylate transporter receptor subunit TctC